MQRYYAALEACDPARALQQAQTATLTSRRPGLSHSHPFFWAGVTLIGRP
jgi:CHAT domain-containing protein